MAARTGRYSLIVSPKLLWELQAVLERPKARRYLSVTESRLYVVSLREFAEVIEDPPVSGQVHTPDPDDDYLVALALADRG